MHNVTRQPQFDLGDRLIEYSSGLVMVEIGMFDLGCRSIGSPDPFHGDCPGGVSERLWNASSSTLQHSQCCVLAVGPGGGFDVSTETRSLGRGPRRTTVEDHAPSVVDVVVSERTETLRFLNLDSEQVRARPDPAAAAENRCFFATLT